MTLFFSFNIHCCSLLRYFSMLPRFAVNEERERTPIVGEPQHQRGFGREEEAAEGVCLMVRLAANGFEGALHFLVDAIRGRNIPPPDLRPCRPYGWFLGGVGSSFRSPFYPSNSELRSVVGQAVSEGGLLLLLSSFSRFRPSPSPQCQVH